jgi:hypothetical protein
MPCFLCGWTSSTIMFGSHLNLSHVPHSIFFWIYFATVIAISTEWS